MTRKTDQQEAIERLRKQLEPGDTAHTILRHVSRSGMSRSISVVITGKEAPYQIDGQVARACGYTFDTTNGGIKATGTGMDMGFSIVYHLSAVLYPNGFECVGESCPSNDHSNGDRDYTPHHHADGGYANKQRWL